MHNLHLNRLKLKHKIALSVLAYSSGLLFRMDYQLNDCNAQHTYLQEVKIEERHTRSSEKTDNYDAS